MSIAIIAPGHNLSIWAEHFHQVDSEVKVEVWPDISDVNDITCVFVWKHPVGELLKYPNLKLICSMGAGVNHILQDAKLPAGVPITKVVDNHLSRDMSNYVINGILNYQRDLQSHLRAQKEKIWLKTHRWPKKTSIGILGLGVLGQDVAKKLVALEFDVYGYSQTEKSITGVKSYYGTEGMEPFLKAINVLVCMLPLTPQTEGIMNLSLFRQMNQGTYLINVARGHHLVEEDLLKALDEGSISGALLDVFREEPLPADHPFWERQEITITPHNASVTDPETVAKQIMTNYHRIRSGEPFEFVIDPTKGY